MSFTWIPIGLTSRCLGNQPKLAEHEQPEPGSNKGFLSQFRHCCCCCQVSSLLVGLVCDCFSFVFLFHLTFDRWMPPEVLTEGRFEELSDGTALMTLSRFSSFLLFPFLRLIKHVTFLVWAYAVLLWELFSFGELPYKEFDNERVIKEVLSYTLFLSSSSPSLSPFPLHAMYSPQNRCFSDAGWSSQSACRASCTSSAAVAGSESVLLLLQSSHFFTNALRNLTCVHVHCACYLCKSDCFSHV